MSKVKTVQQSSQQPTIQPAQSSQSKYTIEQIKNMEIKELLNVAKELYNNGARRRVKRNDIVCTDDCLFSKAYDRLYNHGYTIECILKDLPPKERQKKPRKPKQEVNETQSE